MALPKPLFVSLQEAARELDVSDERIRYYLQEGHLTAYVPTPGPSRLYDKKGKLANLARAIQVKIKGDEIYFKKLQTLDKNTLEVIEEIPAVEISSDSPYYWSDNINNVQISFAEIERLRSTESQETKTPDKEKKCHDSHDDFIHSLKVTYSSDTSVILTPQGGKSKEYSCQEMGFKSAAKTWKMFIDVLQKDDHKYHVGTYSKDKDHVKIREYNKIMSMLKEFSKKFVIFLNKTYSVEIPATFNVFENTYRKGQDRAGTYVPKFQIYSFEVDSGKPKKLSKDETLGTIKNLGAQLKKEKNDKIKDNLICQITPYLEHAVKNDWISEEKAKSLLIDDPSPEDALAHVARENIDPWALDTTDQ